MLLGLVTVVVSAVLTAGAAWLGWWAGGQSTYALLPAVGLSAFVGYVTFGMYVPSILSIADPGSIRQAKKALHEAQRDGRRLAAARARVTLRVARWQRR